MLRICESGQDMLSLQLFSRQKSENLQTKKPGEQKVFELHPPHDINCRLGCIHFIRGCRAGDLFQCEHTLLMKTRLIKVSTFIALGAISSGNVRESLSLFPNRSL